MNFGELLNKYIEELDIRAKDLSSLSGLGDATISRYRSGERAPNAPETVKKISMALSNLSNGKLNESDLYDEFLKFVPTKANELFSNKFSLLLDELDIKGNKLAEYMNYNPSMISRIRMNKRHPIDLDEFVNQFIKYIEEEKSSKEDKEKLLKILNLNEEESDSYLVSLKNWLLDNEEIDLEFKDEQVVDPTSYLSKLDEFNLDDYIEAIHFNDIKVPTLPFQLSTSRSYVGLKEMREGELDFLKSTVFSKSKEAISMCCDMPMEDMALDLDFSKKWMFGLAMVLKKGLPINIVHNLDRPFNELMLGLESWIPLYMTGLVRPYYMPNRQNEVYGHLHYSSGEVAMVGECVTGHHDEGRYYLTRKKSEVDLFKRTSAQLLEKAKPLMKIYTIDNHKELDDFLNNEKNYSKNLIHRYTTLPIYTISKELLVSILNRNNLNSDEIDRILEYRRNKLNSTKEYLKENRVIDYFYEYEKDDFKDGKIELNIAEAFINKKVSYTYEDYNKHLSLNKSFKEQNNNYNYLILEKHDFKGIQFTISKGKWVLVSKGTHPNISFLIMHPILRDAIENMEMIVTE